MAAVRHYPALDIAWPSRPADIDRECLLAVIDDYAPTAVEDTPLGARVFFASRDVRDRAATAIAAALAVSCAQIEVSDEQWAERSQASLQPVRVGRVIITPLAEPEGSALHASGQLTLIIRPSMGFGTGHHASTRLCLLLLQQTPLDGASVLDIGTGSGVLAIAALKLGAASVRAIDNDGDAIQSAQENLDLNGVAASIDMRQCDLADFVPDGPVDLVTANLTGAHLVSSAGRLDALANHRLILGGLQTAEEAEVRRTFERLGWIIEARADEEGWTGLRLYRG